MNLADKKRAELKTALEAGLVSDPMTMMLISIGVSVGSAMLSRALAPKSPMQQVGLMKGTVQIQNSQQGTFIPEIYGAAPSVGLVLGTAVTWSNVVNSATGANGKIYKNTGSSPVWGQVWDAGAVDATAVQATDDAFIRFVPDSAVSTFMAVAAGFSIDTTPASGLGVGGAPALEFGVICGINQTGVDASNNPIFNSVFAAVINGVRTPDLGTWSSVDEFRVEKRNGAYHLYKGLSEVAIPSPPTPGSTLYIGYSGWRTNYGIATAFDKIGGDIGPPPSAGSGGCKVPAMVTWAKPPLKHSYITNQPTHGGKGHPSTPVENIFYSIDLGLMFCRGPVDLIREYANTDVLMNFDPNLAQPSGVFNPSAGLLGAYSPSTPPDPVPGDDMPVLRNDGDLSFDGNGVGTGTIQHSGSQVAVYPGNYTQQPDPTEEADVDAANGPNSTTAYRGRARIVHNALNLSRWQNLVPNFTAVWQHKTLKTLDTIFASLCQRIVDQNGTALLSNSDYDFSGLAGITVRGMLLDGRRFSPAEILDNQEIQDVYNYFTTEGDGQILAYTNGNEPTVTIPESELGWLDGSAQLPEVFPTLNPILAEETKLPRQIDLKYIDPGSDWEPNTQSAFRKVTLGNTLELLQVQVTLNPDEARTTCDRRLFREYVAGTVVKFTLSWKYLYLYPGYKIIVNSSTGITYTLRLTSITGGVGVRDCEAVALEPSAFNQAGVSDGIPVYNPAQQVPAVTILAAMDLPAFREGEAGLIGMYFAGAPRNTDLQTWNGFALFIKRGGNFIKLSEFPAPAIMGRVVSATSLGTDPNTTDMTGTIVVDLYGTEATLTSVSTSDMVAGLNRAAVGDMIVGFATAVRVAGFPNRWTLSVLRNGQYHTDSHIGDAQANREFVLFNGAVQFIELGKGDINSTLHLKAVSLGQSLNDAAEVTVPFTGVSIKPLEPINVEGARVLNDWVFNFDPPPANPNGFQVVQPGFAADIVNVSTGALIRSLPVQSSMRQAAMLKDYDATRDTFSRSVNGGTGFAAGIDGFLPKLIGHGRSIQTLDGFSYEVEGVVSGAGATFEGAFIGLLPEAVPLTVNGASGAETTVVPFEIRAMPGGGFDSVLRVYENGVDLSGVGGFYLIHPTPGPGQFSKVIRIAVFGSEVHYLYDNQIFYKSKKRPSGPYRFYVGIDNTDDVWGALKMGVGDGSYSTIYAQRQQENDFGSVQTSVRIQIYQNYPVDGYKYDHVFP